MATYSLATTGLETGFITATERQTIPDAAIPASGTTIVTATLGGMMQAMQQNTPLLCKGPDGSFKWYTLDAERSTPTVPVLKAV